MSMHIAKSCLVAAVLTLAASGPAQAVWVVATESGSGVHFTDIQSAVDAASDGDVVLVRVGSYAPFEIRAKALVVAGDGPVTIQPSTGQSSVSVRDIGPQQSVVMRNVSAASTTLTPLSIRNCTGPVTVEEGQFSTPNPMLAANASLAISGSTRVSLIHCSMRGASSVRTITLGMSVSSSTVLMHGCTVSGGPGVVGGISPDGAPAATFQASFVSAYASTFVGGRGAPPFFPFCAFAGQGGDAVVLRDAGSVGYFRDCTVVGGAGGATSGCSTTGTPGVPFSGSGTANILGGPSGSLTAASPVRTGSTATLTVSGPPGHNAWLLASPLQAPIFVAGCAGAIHPDLGTSAVLFLGPVPSTGSTVLSFPVPPLSTAQGSVVFFQMALTTSTGCFVGTPTSVLVVDSRF